MIEDAKSIIQTERNAALRDVKEQVAMFSIEIAEKLIKKNLSDDKSQKELANTFIKDLKLN
jgi:F-type H+-transporting ATPase subunit b